VQRIITDLCVFDVDRERGELVLVELAPATTEGDIRERTEAAFRVAPEVRSIAV
jgi:3-oxoacid CoA-transferase